MNRIRRAITSDWAPLALLPVLAIGAVLTSAWLAVTCLAAAFAWVLAKG